MKIKFIFGIFLLLLQGCSSYHKMGTILPNNASYYKERMAGGSSVYDVMIPYPSSKYEKIQTEKTLYNDTIRMVLPYQIYDKSSRVFTWVLIPLYYGSCSFQKNYYQENDNMTIYIYKSNYLPNFLKNINISLKYNNKIYKGYKDLNYSTDSIKFIYPITIKDIKENGVDLIIDYKNYHKEIPIGYKLMWYRG